MELSLCLPWPSTSSSTCLTIPSTNSDRPNKRINQRRECPKSPIKMKKKDFLKQVFRNKLFPLSSVPHSSFSFSSTCLRYCHTVPKCVPDIFDDKIFLITYSRSPLPFPCHVLNSITSDILPHSLTDTNYPPTHQQIDLQDSHQSIPIRDKSQRLPSSLNITVEVNKTKLSILCSDGDKCSPMVTPHYGE